MTTPQLLLDLERDEGCIPSAYPDPGSPLAQACAKASIAPQDYAQIAGWQMLSGAPWTIAFGHTGREVHPGLTCTQAQAVAWLSEDVGATERGLDTAAPWWETLDPIRQDAVAELGFNLGVHKLVTDFPQTMNAVRYGDYAAAANNLRNDLWARQVGPDRSGRIIHMIQFGARP